MDKVNQVQQQLEEQVKTSSSDQWFYCSVLLILLLIIFQISKVMEDKKRQKLKKLKKMSKIQQEEMQKVHKAEQEQSEIKELNRQLERLGNQATRQPSELDPRPKDPNRLRIDSIYADTTSQVSYTS